MDPPVAPILTCSLDSLSSILFLLDAAELTRLYLSGSPALCHRLLSKYAVNTLCISEVGARGRALLQRISSFPLRRGSLACTDGKALPIVFQLPSITTFIMEAAPTGRRNTEWAKKTLSDDPDSIFWRCLLALPPSLTHLKTQSFRALAIFSPAKRFEQVELGIMDKEAISLRTLFPDLKTLKLSYVTHWRFPSILNLPDAPERVSIQGDISWSYSSALPLDLTTLEVPVTVSNDVFCDLSPHSATHIGLYAGWITRIPQALQSPPHIPKERFAGVISLKLFRFDAFLRYAFHSLVRLSLEELEDVTSAKQLPATLTSLDIGFRYQGLTLPRSEGQDRYAMNGWLAIVEALPPNITHLALHNVSAQSASLYSHRSHINPPISRENGSTIAGDATKAWANPFPPKMRSLRITFTHPDQQLGFKELEDCALEELLPTLPLLEELHISFTSFRLLAPYPRLLRLSILECATPKFSAEHWHLVPALVELKVSCMLDTALIDRIEEHPKNLAFVTARRIDLTGSLLKRHSHTIDTMKKCSLIKDMREMRHDFTLRFDHLAVKPLLYLPNSNVIWSKYFKLDTELLKPRLSLLSGPTGSSTDFENLPALPPLNRLSLGSHDASHLNTMYKGLLKKFWVSQFQRWDYSNLPITVSDLMRLPPSITSVSYAILLFDMDTDLRAISAHWQDAKMLRLAKGAIFSALTQHCHRKLSALLLCNRWLSKDDLHLFPRTVEVLHVEGTFLSIESEELANHFSALTEIHFDTTYSKRMTSMKGLSSLRKITYAAGFDKALGLLTLPPSITSIDLRLKDGIGPTLWPYTRDEPTEPLPWPPALSQLRVRFGTSGKDWDKYVFFFKKTLPANMQHFQCRYLQEKFEIEYSQPDDQA